MFNGLCGLKKDSGIKLVPWKATGKLEFSRCVASH